MTSRLHLKLVRDLLAARWQFLAIALVAALGVALYYGLMLSLERQRGSYERTYEVLGFADVWVPLRRAPRPVVATLAGLPGIRAVEGRISQVVEVEQTGGRRPRVIGRLISMPVGREPAMNRVKVLAGRPLGARSHREVLLEVQFAQANGYRPGDRIYPRFGGRRVAFTVAGIVSSPEFIYAVMGGGVGLPMPGVFGAMFVPEQTLGPLTGMAGQVNEVTLLTEPGEEARAGNAVRERLRAYGTDTPVLRAQQPSNRLLQSDLEGNRPFLVIMPMLFLASASLAVGLMLARWVQAQRGIIGFLRASGMAQGAVLRHYLGVGLLIGIAGGVAGLLIGWAFGAWLGAAYDAIIKTPFKADEARPDLAATAFLLSIAACLAGALGPARRAAAIPPAEAMHGETPMQTGRLPRLRLPLSLVLPTRNLLRRPLRTAGMAAGIASAVILMVIAGTFRDSMTSALDESLDDFRRFNVTVAFVPERSERTVRAIAHWPGVLRAEPTLDIPVKASHDGRRQDTAIMGITADARLRMLRDMDGRRVLPEAGGILFADPLARRIDLESGDVVRLTYPQNVVGRRATGLFRAGVRIRSMVGLPVYMEMGQLRRRYAQRLQMPPDAVSGAVIAVDSERLPETQARLFRTDGVAMVLTLPELKRQIDELTAFAQTFIAVMFLLGAAMAFAVVYTVTDIVLWERTRELATLRTMGYDMGGVARLVTLENLQVATLGIAIAIYPALAAAQWMLDASSTEGFTMLLVTGPGTYLQATVGTLAVVVLAQWPGLRRIRRLDLAEAIRLRE
ncbi:MAG TPA: FtsX-like permease family protein [Chthonomonadales bacterium]|nr:FtsX-like permease family protein [Chthonomonadales bacterium]